VGDGTRASCAILSSCSSVDCCYDFEYLGINLHIYLNIDTCNYVIKGGIEQMTFEYHFFTYTWGKFKNSKFIYNYICGVKVNVLYLNIDTCNYVIKGGIEQMTFEYHFFTYTWGKFKNSKFIYNYICGVKVNVLYSSVVDCVF
jgi:hypothetical protein